MKAWFEKQKRHKKVALPQFNTQKILMFSMLVPLTLVCNFIKLPYFPMPWLSFDLTECFYLITYFIFNFHSSLLLAIIIPWIRFLYFGNLVGFLATVLSGSCLIIGIGIVNTVLRKNMLKEKSLYFWIIIVLSQVTLNLFFNYAFLLNMFFHSPELFFSWYFFLNILIFNLIKYVGLCCFFAQIRKSLSPFVFTKK